MTDWCATQLPGIARRVMAEESDGRPADPYRRAWAEWVLITAAPAAPQPAAAPATPSPTHAEPDDDRWLRPIRGDGLTEDAPAANNNQQPVDAE